MKLGKATTWIFVLSFMFMIGCEETVEVPIEPSISFKSLSLAERKGDLEVVRLHFNLKDGDGDIGLKPEQNFVPFHEFDLVLDTNDELVKQSNIVAPPFYRLRPNGEKLFFSEKDERPDFNAFNYMLMDSTNQRVGNTDTVLIHRNLFHHNIYLTILRKSKGQFIPWNPKKIDTSRPPISGRLDVEGSGNKEQPIVAELFFDIDKYQFKGIKSEDTLKLQFYIFDRKLHQSNPATSPEFHLADLFRSGD